MSSPHALTRRGLLGAGAGASALLTLPARAASASAPPPAAPYRRPATHLAEAERLIEYLRLSDPLDADRNTYLGTGDDRPTLIEWGEPGRPSTSRVRAQCGTFVTAALMRAHGSASEAGWATTDYFRSRFFPDEPVGSGKWAPTAAEFRSGFATADQHLSPVSSPHDLEPGDLVAIDYGSATGITGHVVMVRQLRGSFAHPADDTIGIPVVPLVVEVADCTADPHGDPVNGNLANYEAFPDSRFRPTRDDAGNVLEPASGTGAGLGHMVLYAAQQSGAFAGYRWSVNSATAQPVAARPIAAARPVE